MAILCRRKRPMAPNHLETRRKPLPQPQQPRRMGHSGALSFSCCCRARHWRPHPAPPPGIRDRDPEGQCELFLSWRRFGVVVCLFVCCGSLGGKNLERKITQDLKGSAWTTCSHSGRSLPCSRFAHDCNFYVHRSQNSQYCSHQRRELSVESDGCC
uniref:Uncharacterized protein n=1 Tax=Pipistrellus kuhlii TaxID=59472 RepID=A0A7J7RVY7_PIPKU|nr:hypothetical protein mPipKuh1_010228 [Pipistrellus kuhlii]